MLKWAPGEKVDCFAWDRRRLWKGFDVDFRLYNEVFKCYVEHAVQKSVEQRNVDFQQFLRQVGE